MISVSPLARLALALVLSIEGTAFLRAEISPSSAAFFLDFEKDDPNVRLVQGTRRVQGPYGGALEFTTAFQYAGVDFAHKLDGIQAMSVGGWFFPRRSGEQSFFSRGVIEAGPQGERFFRANPEWVNFVLGTDQHGFFLGTINGNGWMPFPHVTLNEV